MTNATVNRPSAEELSGIRSCRHQHGTWLTTIGQSEQQIDLLIANLRNRPNQTDVVYIQYYNDLKRIKGLFHRLRVDMVCQNGACMELQKQVCCKPRISTYLITTVAINLLSLTSELQQIKTGLSQVCSE